MLLHRPTKHILRIDIKSATADHRANKDTLFMLYFFSINIFFIVAGPNVAHEVAMIGESQLFNFN